MSQTASRPRTRDRAGVASLLPFLGLSLVLAVGGFLTTTPALSTWFTAGPRADWTPQTWVFTAVWTLLYLADGFAGWLLWRRAATHPYGRPVLALYALQLGLQAVWLVGFLAQTLVAGDLLWLVFAAIVVLDLVTAATAGVAWSLSRPASVLLWIMLGWLLFGTVLSGADTLLRTGLPG